MTCNVCYKHEKHVNGHSTSSLRKWLHCSDGEETSQQCRRDHDFSLLQELLGHDPYTSSAFLVTIPIQRGTDS